MDNRSTSPAIGGRRAEPGQREYRARTPGHSRTGPVRKALAGAAIAATVLAGIYAIAATTATGMAAGFTTTQTVNHSRSVEFETETMRAAADRAAARERCRHGTRRERIVCDAAVRVDEERAGFRSLHRADARP